jgi:D-alanine-D-alanine ligase
MKRQKLRVAVLFGGRSAEHEVSIQSAKNVYSALRANNYDVVLVGIDKKGKWYKCPDSYLAESSYKNPKMLANNDEVSLVTVGGKGGLVGGSNAEEIDVIFPVLHGTYGEDGSVQGLLRLSDIPFVGSGVLGSAVGMDKDVAKRLFRDAGLPISQFLVFRKGDEISFNIVKKKLGLPFFVKPANLGSSVGVSKVKSEKEFYMAVNEAFLYDRKILIEEYIPCREIECSVLGNDKPIVSVPGEIVPIREFYDYTAKYLDDHGAKLRVPAEISTQQKKEVQDLALKTFQVLCLEDMARIDFFLNPEGKFYVNEANTIPGFTNISMYPKLWEESGIDQVELVRRLVNLAIERFKNQKQLKTSL